MEMQFNISMDSHYGWIHSEIVASFSGEGARVRNVLFYSRQRAIYHREGGIPSRPHPSSAITLLKLHSVTSVQTSEERPATVGVIAVSDESINIVNVPRAMLITLITAMAFTFNDLYVSLSVRILKKSMKFPE
jgi:hypothetical protein